MRRPIVWPDVALPTIGIENPVDARRSDARCIEIRETSALPASATMLTESVSMNAYPLSVLNDSGSGMRRGVIAVAVCAAGAGATGPAGLHEVTNTLQNTTAARDARMFVMVSLIEVATHTLLSGRKSARKNLLLQVSVCENFSGAGDASSFSSSKASRPAQAGR